MRVLVTGASGYIGHAVAKAFRSKGHQVYGLVRSQEDAHLLCLNEIIPINGDLDEPKSYAKCLDQIEVAVHCAFDSSGQGVERDAKTIDTFIHAFSHTTLPRLFLYTSGIWIYGSSREKLVDEATPLHPIDIVKWRPAHEKKVLEAANVNFKTAILRPGCVYGLVGGLTELLFSSTLKGAVTVVEEGNYRWPMVHVQDLAHAYVSAAEKEISGVILNVVDDSSATVREMAEAIAHSAKLSGKIHSLSYDEALSQFGPLVQGLTINLQVNNSRAKRLLGWQVHHAPFINEIDIHYNAWKTKHGQKGPKGQGLKGRQGPQGPGT